MNEQLKELSTNSMLETMCPSLSTLEKVCLTIPVGTVSVERSFSQMKMLKNQAEEEPSRRHQSFSSHEDCHRITLSDEELEQIHVVDIWNRKSGRIPA